MSDTAAQAEAKLRESEQRYRRLVELSPEAVLAVTHAKVLYVNAAGVRLFGTPIEAEITSAGVNFDGQPAAQLLIRDVGERRAIERMKDELLSIVSHELSTPLTSLRGSLGLLACGLLGTVPASSHGQYLRFTIADTGRGIPTDQLETIFECFRQVDASAPAARFTWICPRLLEAPGALLTTL